MNTLKGQISKIKVAVKYAEKTGRIEKGLLEDIKYPKEANVGSKAKKYRFLQKISLIKYTHIFMINIITEVLNTDIIIGLCC